MTGLAEKLREELLDVIKVNTLETFQLFFNWPVIPTRQIHGPMTTPVYGSTTLEQGNEIDVSLLFAFDRRLLNLIASGIYPAEEAKKDTVTYDLVGEITNIITAKVKKHLNENGYKFEMGFPEIEDPARFIPAHDSSAFQEKLSNNSCLYFEYDNGTIPLPIGIMVDLKMLANEMDDYYAEPVA